MLSITENRVRYYTCLGWVWLKQYFLVIKLFFSFSLVMRHELQNFFLIKTYPMFLPVKGFLIDYGSERVVSELQSTGIPRFSALPFIVLCRYCGVFFLQIEGLWQPCTEQVCRRRFSNSISALPVSGNSRNISNLFIIMFVMVNCYQWSLMLPFVVVLRHHEPLPCKTAILIYICCGYSDCSTNQLFLSLSFSLGFLFPEKQQYWN